MREAELDYPLTKYLSWVFSLLLVYALLGFVCGELRFWTPSGELLVSGVAWKIAAVFCVVLWTFLHLLPSLSPRIYGRDELTGEPRELPQLRIVPQVFLWGLIAILLSEYVGRRFSFYAHQGVRSEVLLLGFLLLPFVSMKGKWEETRFAPEWVLVGIQLLLAVMFLHYAAGRMVFSDDHPSFLYRLALLREHFPNIPFYNTDWNAGYATTEFFPSGVLNAFFLSWPLLFLVEEICSAAGMQLYSFLIAYLFILLLPWAMYAAARVLRMSRAVAVLAAVLAIGPSAAHFQWLLKYGTLGFSISAMLVPLVLALSLRLALDQEHTRWRDVFALLIASALCFFWTMSVLIFIPFVLMLLFRIQHCCAQGRRMKMMVFALLFLAINGPWAWQFVQQPKVQSMLSSKTLFGTTSTRFEVDSSRHGPKKQLKDSSKKLTLADNLKQARKELKSSLVKINPLILLAFIPGLVALRASSHRWALGITAVWLVVLAVLGDMFRPQLEFRRMVLVASFVMTLPAAAGITALMRSACSESPALVRRGFSMLLQACLLGAIVISPVMAGASYLNRTDEQYKFARTSVPRLADAIAEHGGEGRTVFAEFVLHEWGSTKFGNQDGGHIAPLARMSGKSIYGIDFYHGRWGSVSPIPEAFFAKGDAGIEEFFDLLNATAVITLTPAWANRLVVNPRYKLAFEDCKKKRVAPDGFPGACFRLFVRTPVANGYFLRGSGSLVEHDDGFEITPGSSEMVVKYRYHPNLRVTPAKGVELFSVPAFVENLGGGKEKPVDYIGVRISEEIFAKHPRLRISF